MGFHVKWWDKVEDHVISILNVDVPDTLCVVRVATRVIRTRNKTRVAVI